MNPQDVRSLWMALFLAALMALPFIGGCANPLPRDQPIEVNYLSTGGSELRGVEQVQVRPDLSVDVIVNGARYGGAIEEWRYNRLLASIRRMNFDIKLASLLAFAEPRRGMDFQLTAEIGGEAPRRLVWKGDHSDPYVPVLQQLSDISRAVSSGGLAKGQVQLGLNN
ncbi:MAG: hypothetical protein C4523_16030 [Myxococcales bacterium]|nr:MAG: hypothetical protein C4523_16030 [Myxococcales bacterium]